LCFWVIQRRSKEQLAREAREKIRETISNYVNIGKPVKISPICLTHVHEASHQHSFALRLILVNGC